MKFDSPESEESDDSLQNRFAHPNKRGCEGRADCGAQELGKGQDAARQHQNDEGGNESVL